jgi:hypothetical protein
MSAFDPLRTLRRLIVSPAMKVFRPKMEAWLPLFIIGLPISGLGVVALVQDPSGWMWDVVAIALGLGLFGYNATARLVLTSDEVVLKRYGRTVWRAPLRGTRLVEGRGGQPPILPAFLLCHGKTKVGYILKVWFDERAVTELRRALS